MQIRWAAVLAAATVAAGQAQTVDFARDVQKIFLARCASCHLVEQPQAELSLHTRASILKGGVSGPAVIPGNSRGSLLIQRVTGFAAPVMPMGAEPLSDGEIQVLRDWIDQGAEGAAARSTDASPKRAGALRRPQVPAGQAANPLDRFVEAYLRRHGAAMQQPVADDIFIRRVYLDLWGLPPTPEQRRDFSGDFRPGKRERLVDRLLADKTNYSEHWISFWNDLLRNDEGVVYHGSRQSITAWLLKALEDNLPYNQFVAALLNPARPGDPAGFLVGVNWRGDVSASQTPVMQAAQNSAQVFLGVNLKCNSCHDSFVSSWKLKDAYGLASYFAPGELEIYRCDVATGEKSEPKFLFADLAAATPGATLEERRAAVSKLFTTPENGRLPRTLVNRYWKRLFGRGLVEPVDDLDAAPWDAGLLDWLAADFVDHGYDLKFLLRRIILTSRAYQLPAVAQPRDNREYVFRGPYPRRLTAEQFVDSVSAVTGEWRVLTGGKAGVASYSREWRLKSTTLTRALGRPIRDQVYTERDRDPATLQALELVNGETLASLLRRGAKRMLGEWQPPPANLFDSGVIRAERVAVDVDVTGARELRLLVQDVDSYDRTRVIAGWVNAELVSAGGITQLADLSSNPGVEKRTIRIKGQGAAEGLTAPIPAEVVYDIAGKGFTRFRAVVGVDESSLQNDISPRVRFFVFTEEPDRERLVRVAESAPAKGAKPSPEDLINRIYRHAYARDPLAGERQVAQEFLKGTSSDGLSDLLWSVFMSPEFQYIR